MSSINFTLHEYDLSIEPVLYNLLKKVDNEFIPSLHEWLNIQDYAHKLAEKAVCWLAHDGQNTVGFAACYFNEAPLYSFWTMLAIQKEYRNRMIALQLEPKVIEYCKKKGSRGIQAEVEHRHLDLIKLHQYFGFQMNEKKSNLQGREWVEMQLTF